MRGKYSIFRAPIIFDLSDYSMDGNSLVFFIFGQSTGLFAVVIQ